jgi:anti-sigma regulatory factor (Ser/Thr protein kinase)
MTAAFERELPRTNDAAWIARSAVAEWFGVELEQDQLQSAKLLTSELVANAVLHGEGRILIRAELNRDRVLVEVIDEGMGFEHKVRKGEFEDVHGRGLSIVDAESSRWGIHEGTTHVWFELERPGPRLGEESKPPV